MAYEIYKHVGDVVTIAVEAQRHKAGHFSLPQAVADILGVKWKDYIYIRIESKDGKNVLWQGKKQLKSGLEIYGRELRSAVGPGAILRVAVSNPAKAEQPSA